MAADYRYLPPPPTPGPPSSRNFRLLIGCLVGGALLLILLVGGGILAGGIFIARNVNIGSTVGVPGDLPLYPHARQRPA
jgi:hypothetical protein